jgi:hypothetical protein
MMNERDYFRAIVERNVRFKLENKTDLDSEPASTESLLNDPLRHCLGLGTFCPIE